jgi:hypothetical protein
MLHLVGIGPAEIGWVDEKQHPVQTPDSPCSTIYSYV